MKFKSFSPKENILARVADNLDEELNKYMSDVIAGWSTLEGVDSLALRRRLFQENKELLENEIIQDLKNEVSELLRQRNELYQKNRFELSDRQEEKIKHWENTHDCSTRGQYKGAIGGRYTYKFIPTSIGVFCTVKCSCGAELDASEI